MAWRRKPGQCAARLPRELAVLGELGVCALHDPARDVYYSPPWQPGIVLCADESGREMFALRPLRAQETRPTDEALAVAELHERFVHDAADGFYNCAVRPLRKERLIGGLAIIRYYADKAIELEDDESDDVGDEPMQWEHYFEDPGRGPAYPDVYDVGHGQLWIPRGPWKAGEAGIEFAQP